MVAHPQRRPPSTAVSVAVRRPQRLPPADPASPFHALEGASVRPPPPPAAPPPPLAPPPPPPPASAAPDTLCVDYALSTTWRGISPSVGSSAVTLSWLPGCTRSVV